MSFFFSTVELYWFSGKPVTELGHCVVTQGTTWSFLTLTRVALFALNVWYKPSDVFFPPKCQVTSSVQWNSLKVMTSLRAVGFFLQCLFVLAAAMYFDLGELEERCIIQEIPIDTLVTGKSLKKKKKIPLWVHELSTCFPVNCFLTTR